MIPHEDPKLLEEALDKDLKKVITRKGRVVRAMHCTNPSCFEDTCHGECEEED
jgi:hypothetical protein